MKKALALLGFFVAILPLCQTALAYDSTDSYSTRQCRGWTLRINKTLITSHTSLTSNVLELVDHQLFQITRVVPAPALARLRDVPIWIELTEPLNPGATYHPSPQWLREHGMNPDKAQCVEISNATNFLAWTKDQPWMLLHELAHSYHHRVLGFENLEIKAAYKEAVDLKKYESVLDIYGKHVRHYALTNEKEYFAECSEAFFGVNDFYPFVRSELQEFDPKMYALLSKLWGVTSVAPPQGAKPTG